MHENCSIYDGVIQIRLKCLMLCLNIRKKLWVPKVRVFFFNVFTAIIILPHQVFEFEYITISWSFDLNINLKNLFWANNLKCWMTSIFLIFYFENIWQCGVIWGLSGKWSGISLYLTQVCVWTCPTQCSLVSQKPSVVVTAKTPPAVVTAKMPESRAEGACRKQQNHRE